MRRPFHGCVALGFVLCAMLFVGAASSAEPKHGGILKLYHRESPGSASILEEATYSTNVPFMPVFNNLVIYDQHVAQNSLQSIVPELATSWAWGKDNTELTFKLRQGVKWHDGKPFTSKTSKDTFDMLMGQSSAKFRKNPRANWYQNVADVTTNGDYEAAFHLKRPQPALLALLASGYSPIYPCHVSPADMRTRPIGTGPFKFVARKQNDSIKLTRNPDYWKKGLPYLDGIEFSIISNRSTAMLAFIAGRLDMTFPTEESIPLLKDMAAQAPQAVCSLVPLNVSTNIILNRDVPPFNNPQIRRALALTLDRKAFVDILSEGKADVGASMLPPPEGIWGMPKKMLETIPGYGLDVAKNRAEARALMEQQGYGPEKRLDIKVSTRNLAVYRDPAVILIDQLKEIYVDGELEPVETGSWFAKVARKDYVIGLHHTRNSVDDPHQHYFHDYA